MAHGNHPAIGIVSGSSDAHGRSLCGSPGGLRDALPWLVSWWRFELNIQPGQVGAQPWGVCNPGELSAMHVPAGVEQAQHAAPVIVSASEGRVGRQENAGGEICLEGEQDTIHRTLSREYSRCMSYFEGRGDLAKIDSTTKP